MIQFQNTWKIRWQRFFTNRNSIMVMALGLGLIWGTGAQWTEKLVLPLLVIVMTISTMGVTGSAFRSFKGFLMPALAGIAMNYLVLGSFILALNALLIRDETLRTGFVILAAVPPAVAVLPFAFFLNGDSSLALLGMIGAYLGALVITPVLALLFLGSNFTDPLKLIFIMVELILLPLIFSRILVRTGWAFRLNPMKGPVTNWSFFVLSYTIVGLNRNMFLSQPLSLVPVALIAFGSTLFLGWIIERVGKALQSDPRKLTSLVLLGTLKNYGLAGGLALALFSKQSAVPATVSTVFMIVYVIWLELKKQRPGDHD